MRIRLSARPDREIRVSVSSGPGRAVTVLRRDRHVRQAEKEIEAAMVTEHRNLKLRAQVLDGDCRIQKNRPGVKAGGKNVRIGAGRRDDTGPRIFLCFIFPQIEGPSMDVVLPGAGSHRPPHQSRYMLNDAAAG